VLSFEATVRPWIHGTRLVIGDESHGLHILSSKAGGPHVFSPRGRPFQGLRVAFHHDPLAGEASRRWQGQHTSRG
jgi:hypothetical protein